MQITMDLDNNNVPTLDQQINDLMNRFNFARVLQVMQAINWTWRGQAVNLDDLKSTAMELMDQAVRHYRANDGRRAQVSTGGFAARVEETDKGARLTLTFSVESVDAYMY
jgi:hypothetical protein